LSNRGIALVAGAVADHGQVHDKLKILDISSN